nr:receptor-type tyrosine-protein phosphatase epsilon-like isoform X2 [Crassostrea gigas]
MRHFLLAIFMVQIVVYTDQLLFSACHDLFYELNCTNQFNKSYGNHSLDNLTTKFDIDFQPYNITNQLPAIYIIGGYVAVIVAPLLIIGFLSICTRSRSRGSTKGGDSERNIEDTDSVPYNQNAPPILVPPKYSNVYQNVNIEFNQGPFSSTTATIENQDRTPLGVDPDISMEEDVDIDDKIHDENPYGNLPASNKQIPDISLRNLENEILEKSKEENDGFKKEYATLKYGERYPCEVGKLPENLSKNRFKYIFPYDHSRVILANRSRDYINANYIDGLKKKSQFIACQGPTPNTLVDFWSMVWQERVDQIVMLTNLKEGTRTKCDQYWPNLETSMTLGDNSVHTLDEKHYANYVIRKMKLTNQKLKCSKIIIQYHYTAWPDHGTPYPLCLLLFHDHVMRSKCKSQDGPTLVHCSAGIGRTGTYIAIDVLFEAGKIENKINIAEFVMKMRRNRMNMVQTYEQYKTIFLTLNEMFKAPAAALNTMAFLTKLKPSSNRTTASDSPLRKEFQKLQAIRPRYTEADYTMASECGDFSSSIRPLDKYILYLMPTFPERGNYISAITIPSTTKPFAFIITKYPKPETIVDFLRLITDYDSEVVVCMEPLSSIESANYWMPSSSKPLSASSFTLNVEQHQDSEIRICKINISKSDETWAVNIADPTSFLTLVNSETVAKFLALVSFVQKTETKNPIIVISRDGAALCGVFCAVYNLIQQLTMDEEIDVFSVVRLLQTRRPELCSTMEEYTLIHDILMSFIRSRMGEHIYYNQ